MSRRVVKYVHSDELVRQADKHPAVRKRASMTHELIRCYDLLQHMQPLAAKRCNAADLRWFHSRDYIRQYDAYAAAAPLLPAQDSDSDPGESEEDTAGDPTAVAKYGLAFDCPPWPGIKEYLCHIAGATMTACEEMCRWKPPEGQAGRQLVVLNWTGGWHHARRDRAAGYCYVNDIVLGILVLGNRYRRVLYVDLDVHHGDGVEEAFQRSRNVFTLSLHRYDPGFYPCTGLPEDCGTGPGEGYAANFTFTSGIAGGSYVKYFKRIAGRIFSAYQPDCCVVQCGGDVIVGDPTGWTNVRPEHIVECAEFVLQRGLATLLLGGGGYNFVNTSRLWTQLTAAACGVQLSDDIPDSNRYFLKYGPGYELAVRTEVRLRDENATDDLDNVAETVEKNLEAHKVGEKPATD